MARTIYVTTQLTGGGTGSLDGINGNSIVAGDMAIYVSPSTRFNNSYNELSYSIYRASTVALSEVVPRVITPDINPGSWNWLMQQPLTLQWITTGLNDNMRNVGQTVIRSSGPTVHRMTRPFAGAEKHIVIQTSHLIKIRLSTEVATYGVKCGTSNCVIINSSRSSTMTAPIKNNMNWIHLVGRSSARWDIVGMGPTARSFKFSTTT